MTHAPIWFKGNRANWANIDQERWDHRQGKTGTVTRDQSHAAQAVWFKFDGEPTVVLVRPDSLTVAK